MFSEATYDGDRLVALTQEPSLASNPRGQSAEATIEWENGWMRRITVARMQTGNVITTVELDGECWLTVDQLREWTPHGSLLGSEGL